MMHAQVLLDLLIKKSEMSAVEQEALLCELMACYISKGESPLMRFLLKKDFEGFKNKVIYMNEVGNAIKGTK